MWRACVVRQFVERFSCLQFQGPRRFIHLLSPLSLSSIPTTAFSSSPTTASTHSSFIKNGGNLRTTLTSASTVSAGSSTSALDTDSSSASSDCFSVRIQCPIDSVDTLSEALLCFGASSVSIDEDENHDTASHAIWISSIFTEEVGDVGLCISQAADSIGLRDTPRYHMSKVEQFDWLKKSQESFDPVHVIEDVWIVPEWRTPPDTRATNIILNPGLAFGTGEHPTTKLCLLLLYNSIKGGELVLDYGTGSGILAIAALKFGAALSVGIDIDPQAITSARQNAALNNIIPENMQLHLVPCKSSPYSRDKKNGEYIEKKELFQNVGMPEKGKYNVVIANILLNPLLDLADDIISYAKPGAIVGLSGIIKEQFPYIGERYSIYLEDITVSEMDDWACISGRKRSIPGVD
ncbi:hypothetical protein RJ641_034394 [Dillenia turbinata]|uniref:ETFB lysine methyltransferase n=1 Tax=Dillenia turbinata TaxID=194707 RepID=A0AAN8VIH7_9MAGN